MKYKNLALIMHSNGIYGVVYALADFLKKHCENLVVIKLPIDDKESLFKKSTIEVFKNGELVETKTLSKQKESFLDHFYHLKESVSDLDKIMKKHEIDKFDIIWGADPLATLGAIINRFLRRTKKVIYYIVDYSEDRFDNKLINWIYRKILIFAAKKSDTNWNVNTAIKAAIEKLIGASDKNLVTLPSTDLSKIDLQNANKEVQHIVVLSNLGLSLDIDLMFKSYMILKKKFPKLKLTIIGDGPGRPAVKKWLREVNDGSIDFKGAMKYGDLLKILPRFHIGLAPYAEDKSKSKNWNFANNLTTKYVDYIACGLPVVSTNAIPGSKKLAELGCGLETECDCEDFAEKIERVLEDEILYNRLRKTGLKVVQNYSSDAIYRKALNV